MLKKKKKIYREPLLTCNMVLDWFVMVWFVRLMSRCDAAGAVYGGWQGNFSSVSKGTGNSKIQKLNHRKQQINCSSKT